MIKSPSSYWWRDIFTLVLVFSILYGLFLGSRPLMAPDEGRYAEIPREMVVNENYITPHLNGIKYFEKPPLFYWIEREAIQLFDTSEWALRVAPLLIGVLGLLMVYFSTRTFFGRRTGLLASYLLGGSLLYFTMAHFISPDLTLTVLLSGSLLAFMLGIHAPYGHSRTRYMWAMYALAALATLTKGLIGFVFPGAIIFVWLCVMNNWRDLKTYCLPSGLLLFLLIALPWHILVQLKNPEFFQFYVVDQHVMRYLTDYAQREQPIWFFPVFVALGFFPGTLYLLFSLLPCKKSSHSSYQTILNNAPSTKSQEIIRECAKKKNWRMMWANRQQHKEMIFLILWALVILLFFTFSHSLLISYVLPMLPPLAIITAYQLDKIWDYKHPRVMNFCFTAFLLIGVATSIIGALLVPPVDFMGISHIFWYISLALLAAAVIVAAVIYWLRGFKAGFITLFIGLSACMISINLSYATIDQRSVKPLAKALMPLLQPNTEVAIFRNYFQDLPVYIKRRVMLVNFQGELAFGMEHADTSAWVIADENSFWKRWEGLPRMFMVMSLQDYNDFKAAHPTLYPVAQTPQNILVTNQPQ